MEAETSTWIAGVEAVTVSEEGRLSVRHTDLCIETGTVRFRDPEDGRPPGARMVSGSGLVAMPAWVNAHTHLYSSLARGLALGGTPPGSFVEILKSLWWRLDRELRPEEVRLSALVGAVEAARSGCGVLFDHHSSPGAIEGSLDQIAEALREVGLRASLCYEVSDRDGAAALEAGVTENLRFAERAEVEGLLGAMFGLHASFTLGASSLRRCVEAAREAGLGCHVHVAEDRADQADSLARTGRRVVERLDRAGVLGPQTLAAHGLHLSDGEIDFLARSGTTLVHNPRSNMNNGVGAVSLEHYRRRGVAIALGTDGMSGHVGEELAAAGLLQRHHRGRSWAGYAEVLEAALVENRRLARRLDPAWSGLADGAPADLVLLRYDPPTPLRDESVAGHLFFGLACAPVHSLYVAGRPIVEEGRLLSADEAAIRADARKAAEQLWRRLA